MEERGESLYVYFWRIFFATLNEYAKDPLGLRDVEMLSGMLAADQENSFKVMIAYEMTNLDSVQDVLGDDSSNAVIGARNQRAIDVLRREIDAGARRIGIFYGVAHLPDLEDRLLSFEVTDDGVGFPQAATNGSSTGLAGLADRIEAVGGKLTVASTPGKGTTVHGSVAVAAPARPGVAADVG